jgi:hypothetical protein
VNQETQSAPRSTTFPDQLLYTEISHIFRYEILLFILTANGFLPGGSDNTIRHNKQITHVTQNNTTIKRNTAHKTIMPNNVAIHHRTHYVIH